MTQGTKQEGRDRVQAEREDLGHIPLLGSTGGNFGGFLTKTGLVNSNQKEQCFGKLCRVLI